jgi:hypothetical protein
MKPRSATDLHVERRLYRQSDARSWPPAAGQPPLFGAPQSPHRLLHNAPMTTDAPIRIVSLSS